ncbi:hypothetical protein [Sorangium sp. So ce131]|uniref:hypothetical protein n=1 Tax=Sorangium sp. So ce131 TaxID=3133282 RepID=UPI003F6331C6
MNVELATLIVLSFGGDPGSWTYECFARAAALFAETMTADEVRAAIAAYAGLGVEQLAGAPGSAERYALERAEAHLQETMTLDQVVLTLADYAGIPLEFAAAEIARLSAPPEG